MLLLTFVCFAYGCTTQSQRPPVVTAAVQLDSYVGKLVTIRGEVTNTKIPAIMGVDVQSFDPDLRGEQAEATGFLQRHMVTPEQIAEANYANCGPGVFYRLKDQESPQGSRHEL